MQQLSAEEREQTSQDLTLAVHKAFFGYAASLDQREVARQALQRSEDHVRLARDRKAAGDAPQLEVVRAESDAAEARLALIRREGMVLQARGRLATTLGFPASTPIEVEANQEVPPTPDEAALKEAEELAEKARPSLRAASKAVDAAAHNVKLARSAYMPRLTAAASYGREDALWYPDDKTWYAGVTMAVPVFSGFAHRAGLAKAKMELAKAEVDAQQLTLSVKELVWDAYASVLTARQAIDAAESQVLNARASERLARARYLAGADILTSLLDAETSLARAESSLASARWDFKTELSTFRWSYGGLTQ